MMVKVLYGQAFG